MRESAMRCHRSLEGGEDTQDWGMRTRAALIAEEVFEQSLDKYFSTCSAKRKWVGRNGTKQHLPWGAFPQDKVTFF